MARRTEPITGLTDDLRALLPSTERAWLVEATAAWGSCGRLLRVDGDPLGVILYAPAGYVPWAAGFPTAPVSPDAVLLARLYVVPDSRGGGLGRLLVQAAARDLLGRKQTRALEGFADTRGLTGEHTLPLEFFQAVGFKTQRAHARTPRMRLDLASTVRVRGLRGAWGRLVAGLAPDRIPAKGPKPARTDRHSRTRPSDAVER